MKILLAGGGTAGHTSPLLATAGALAEIAPEAEIIGLGTAEGLEARLVPQAGYRLETIPRVPLPRKPNAAFFALPVTLTRALRRTGAVFDRVQPDVVVGFGGYVSVPAYLMARKRNVPIVVHEGNALPGVANRVGSWLTPHVATSFPDTPLRHAQYLGLPLRRAITSLDRKAQQRQAREFFGLDPDRPTLLVTGGSQGARAINYAVSQASAALAEAGVQVLHAAGRVEEVTPEIDANSPPYIVVPFIERMELALAAADLIVCRAGANTVLETAAVGLPAVFVPLPIGNGEQARNADPLVAAQAAIAVENDKFTAQWVSRPLVNLITDRERLAAMSQAATDLVPRDADVQLAKLIVEAAQ